MTIDEFFDYDGKPEKQSLREQFGENPFSILDARRADWQQRKRRWRQLGIQSDKGREIKQSYGFGHFEQFAKISQVSIFDPYLCEILYNWFCPDKGKILDPFCGGSVRGIVANYLGYNYTGIDIRQQQIDSNIQQAEKIIPNNIPCYITGDALLALDGIPDQIFDFVFSCPPYGDLQVYSNLQGDISNMPYDKFLAVYRQIIDKSCRKLKHDRFACFVVGQFRNKKGNYVGFVPDTIRAFQAAGMNYYNEMILAQPIVSAALRAKTPFVKSKKITKIHQNILVFRKD